MSILRKILGKGLAKRLSERAMKRAAEKGHKGVVALLLEHKAPIDVRASVRAIGAAILRRYGYSEDIEKIYCEFCLPIGRKS